MVTQLPTSGYNHPRKEEPHCRKGEEFYLQQHSTSIVKNKTPTIPKKGSVTVKGFRIELTN